MNEDLGVITKDRHKKRVCLLIMGLGSAENSDVTNRLDMRITSSGNNPHVNYNLGF
jgi:hypothetical protein